MNSDRQVHTIAGMVVALGLFLLLSGCNRAGETAAKTPQATEPRHDPVRYVKVGQQTFSDELDLPAKVQPDPTKVVHIFPPASGRVLAINVKPGDRVRRGEELATLSSSDVATARSDFAKASIEADRAKRAMERQKVLFDHGAAAEKDYIDARALAETAGAELARAKQRLQQLNISASGNQDQVTLVSPANGVVLDVSAAPGELSKSLDSANPLITVADLDRVWIVGDVYEKDIAKVALGKAATVTLEAYPGQQWMGRIASLSGALDPTTRTLKVRLPLPNPDQHLRPEMFGTVHVKAGTHQALVVPAAAIIQEGNATIVFVNSAGKPEQRTVTVGQTADGQVEVLSGLRIGEEVAAQGAELLKGGPAE